MRKTPPNPFEPLEPRNLLAAAPASGLDLSFGGGAGFVELPLAYDVALTGSAVAPDGNIVVCGYTRRRSVYDLATGYTPGRDFFLARLRPDGSLDPAFGPDGTGVVTTDIVYNDGGFRDNQPTGVSVLADGGLLVAFGNGASSRLLAHYLPNGAFDETFGHPPFNARHTQTLDLDVKALVAGPGGTVYAAGRVPGTDPEFGVVRVNPDGTLDASFLQGAFLPSNVGANDAAVLPDGRVVLAGRFARSSISDEVIDTGKDAVYGMALTAFNPDGSPDMGFGWWPGGRRGAVPPAGRTFLRPPKWEGSANAVAAGTDGKIIAAGFDVTSVRWSGGPVNRHTEPHTSAFWVARLNGDGTPDPTFGRRGSSHLRPGVFNFATDVAAAPGTGAVTVAGLTAATKQDLAVQRFGYAVARLTARGRPDRTFGRRGTFSLPFAAPAETWEDPPGPPIGFGPLPQTSERALLASDAEGRTLVLAAANSKLFIARLSSPPGRTAGRRAGAGAVRAGPASEDSGPRRPAVAARGQPAGLFSSSGAGWYLFDSMPHKAKKLW